MCLVSKRVNVSGKRIIDFWGSFCCVSALLVLSVETDSSLLLTGWELPVGDTWLSPSIPPPRSFEAENLWMSKNSHRQCYMLTHQLGVGSCVSIEDRTGVLLHESWFKGHWRWFTGHLHRLQGRTIIYTPMTHLHLSPHSLCYFLPHLWPLHVLCTKHDTSNHAWSYRIMMDLLGTHLKTFNEFERPKSTPFLLPGKECHKYCEFYIDPPSSDFVYSLYNSLNVVPSSATSL